MVCDVAGFRPWSYVAGTRAGVHGGDQLEAGREAHAVAGTGNYDMP